MRQIKGITSTAIDVVADNKKSRWCHLNIIIEHHRIIIGQNDSHVRQNIPETLELFMPAEQLKDIGEKMIKSAENCLAEKVEDIKPPAPKKKAAKKKPGKKKAAKKKR